MLIQTLLLLYPYKDVFVSNIYAYLKKAFSEHCNGKFWHYTISRSTFDFYSIWSIDNQTINLHSQAKAYRIAAGSSGCFQPAKIWKTISNFLVGFFLHLILEIFHNFTNFWNFNGAIQSEGSLKEPSKSKEINAVVKYSTLLLREWHLQTGLYAQLEHWRGSAIQCSQYETWNLKLGYMSN